MRGSDLGGGWRMVALRDGLPDRLAVIAFRLVIESSGQVTGDRWLACAGVGGGSGSGAGSGEELVHDLGAGGDDGPEFAAVDDLGGAGGGVPGEAGDLLDADSLVAHQADEGGAQFTRGPVVPGAGFGADALEHLPDVARVQGGAPVAG